MNIMTKLNELARFILSDKLKEIRNYDCYDKLVAEAERLQREQVKNLIIPVVNAGFLPKCTRVEVIDKSGRAYVNWKPTNKVEMQMQDDDKTLKVFIY